MQFKIDSFDSDRSRYVVGDVATITVHFDGDVGVDLVPGRRVPELALSNGGRATYVSGSGTDAFVFKFTFI